VDQRDIVAALQEDPLPRLEHRTIVGVPVNQHDGIPLHWQKYTAAEPDGRARV
jgi:hypothetical protein